MFIFLKRSMYVFLLWVTCLWTPVYSQQLVYSQQFDYAISLGSYCMVAVQLSKYQARDRAYPLDWVYSSFDGMLKFLKEEGRHFLFKQHLLFDIVSSEQIVKVVYDLNYDAMCFPHDFDFDFILPATIPCTFTQVNIKNYEDVLAKYQRRVARFFEVLRSDKTVLLVRYDISYEQAILLDSLLRTKYPRLKYTILALGPAEEMKNPWGLERVHNYYMPHSLDLGCMSITSLWQHVFSQFQLPKVTTDPASLPWSTEK